MQLGFGIVTSLLKFNFVNMLTRQLNEDVPNRLVNVESNRI